VRSVQLLGGLPDLLGAVARQVGVATRQREFPVRQAGERHAAAVADPLTE